MKKDYDPQTHIYVPKHIIMKDEDVKELLKKYNISKKQLPKIYKNDPIIKAIGAEVGNVVKIVRKSPTTIEAETYRMVING